MSTNIKVNGIYDVVTMKYFLEQGIFNVSFDLRPKSLNFIQTYLIASLLEQTEMSRCYLHFCDEKKFVIDKILEDLSSVIGRHSLYLEFSGHQDREFYDSFKKPYFLHIDDEAKIDSDLMKGEYLEGIIFPYHFLDHLHRYGKLPEIVARFYKSLQSKESDLKYILERDWQSDPFPSLCEYFTFHMTSLPINDYVESSFRQVNLERLKQELSYITF